MTSSIFGSDSSEVLTCAAILVGGVATGSIVTGTIVGLSIGLIHGVFSNKVLEQKSAVINALGVAALAVSSFYLSNMCLAYFGEIALSGLTFSVIFVGSALITMTAVFLVYHASNAILNYVNNGSHAPVT